MKLSQPPSLATWVLEHLVRREDDALAGDLMEEFSRGRSARWYWYQVLAALCVSFSEQLRTGWTAILFAVIVSSAFPYTQIWHSSEFERVFGWLITFPWPWSMFFGIAFWSAFEAGVLFVAFAAYLGATRRLSLRSFLKGSLAALVALALGNLGVNVLWVLRPSRLLFDYVIGYVIWRLPLFFGLVLAIWVARSRTARPEATLRSA
jgi:hypothetical protein